MYGICRVLSFGCPSLPGSAPDMMTPMVRTTRRMNDCGVITRAAHLAFSIGLCVPPVVREVRDAAKAIERFRVGSL